MRRLHLSSIRVRALQPWIIVLAVTAAIVTAGLVARAQTSIQVGADPSKFVLRGTIVDPNQVLKGEVVIDGDTIEVMHSGRAERIRIFGIDCPERGQPYGTKARQSGIVGPASSAIANQG